MQSSNNILRFSLIDYICHAFAVIQKRSIYVFIHPHVSGFLHLYIY